MPQIDINRSQIPAQWTINQMNLDQIANPVNEGSDRGLKLTLADIARQQQMEDTNKSMGFAREQATTANSRAVEAAKVANKNILNRDKALDEQLTKRQRAQKMMDLARMGVGLPENATDAQIAKAEREHMTKTATRVISLFDKEADDNEKETKAEIEKYNKIFSQSASPEAKQAALATVLADPTVRKTLSKADFKKLEDARNSRDPEKVVAEVATKIGEKYWWNATEKAQLLTDAFRKPLLDSITGERQVELQQQYSTIKNLQANQQLINKNRYDAARQHIGWLDDATYNRISTTVGAPTKKEASKVVPEDPNAVLAGETYQSDSIPLSGLAGSVNTPPVGGVVKPDAPVPTGQLFQSIQETQKLLSQLSQLPPEVHDQIRSTALQLGVPQQEVDAKDQILKSNLPVDDPRMREAIQGTMRILQVMGQTPTNAAPVPAPATAPDDGLSDWRNQRAAAGAFVNKVKNFQIPDIGKMLPQIPDPFAKTPPVGR